MFRPALIINTILSWALKFIFHDVAFVNLVLSMLLTMFLYCGNANKVIYKKKKKKKSNKIQTWQASDNLMKIGQRITEWCKFEISQYFMKHQYQYANWLVDEVIASQLSIVIFEYEIFNLSVTLLSPKILLQEQLSPEDRSKYCITRKRLRHFVGKKETVQMAV